MLNAGCACQFSNRYIPNDPFLLLFSATRPPGVIQTLFGRHVGPGESRVH